MPEYVVNGFAIFGFISLCFFVWYFWAAFNEKWPFEVEHRELTPEYKEFLENCDKEILRDALLAEKDRIEREKNANQLDEEDQ